MHRMTTSLTKLNSSIDGSVGVRSVKSVVPDTRREPGCVWGASPAIRPGSVHLFVAAEAVRSILCCLRSGQDLAGALEVRGRKSCYFRRADVRAVPALVLMRVRGGFLATRR